jgi:hypothetical protein
MPVSIKPKDWLAGQNKTVRHGRRALIVATSLVGLMLSVIAGRVFGTQLTKPTTPEPRLVLWYSHPADNWENAFPVGNGRLGAMVFGRTDEEQIQINDDT